MADYSILISGHSKEWRKNLVAAFKQSGYERIFTEDQGDLMQYVREIYPDVLLRRVENHAEAVEQINMLKEVSPFSIAVIIVDNPDSYDIPELISCGMMGCLPIRLRPRQIVAAVELIVAAGIICMPRLSPRDMEQYQNNDLDLMLLLTSREQEILNMLGQNKSNQEIADELYLSISTVKTHLRSIFRKLGLRSRRDAQELLRTMGSDDRNGAVRPKTNKNTVTADRINETARLHIIK
ncbi:MAG TPA: response regulator transcription factor [Syntrophomonadaceae bacterium]|nr:response regulator transcription factor [Syntrophomonadaceae bacterium]HNX92123.1 response regulator transcription factor [Syntrophomonas sp.]